MVRRERRIRKKNEKKNERDLILNSKNNKKNKTTSTTKTRKKINDFEMYNVHVRACASAASSVFFYLKLYIQRSTISFACCYSC
jgi:hypothetical protein